jgi:hypothetical protein
VTGKNQTESKKERRGKHMSSTTALLSNLQSKLDDLVKDSRIDERTYLELCGDLKKSYEKTAEEATAEKLQVFAEMSNSYILNAIDNSVVGIEPFDLKVLKAIVRVAHERGKCGCFFMELITIYAKLFFSNANKINWEWPSGIEFMSSILNVSSALNNRRYMGYFCHQLEKQGDGVDLSDRVDEIYKKMADEEYDTSSEAFRRRQEHARDVAASRTAELRHTRWDDNRAWYVTSLGDDDDDDPEDEKQLFYKGLVMGYPKSIKNLYSFKKKNKEGWKTLVKLAHKNATVTDKEDDDFCRIMEGKKRLKRKRKSDGDDDDVCLGC